MQGHTAVIGNVRFSPDGALLASASEDNTIMLWDTRNAAHLRTLEKQSKYVYDVCFSADGKCLASAGEDGVIRIWDVASGARVKSLYGHANTVTSVCFSPTGTVLASAGSNCTVRLWELKMAAVSDTKSNSLSSGDPADVPVSHGHRDGEAIVTGAASESESEHIHKERALVPSGDSISELVAWSSHIQNAPLDLTGSSALAVEGLSTSNRRLLEQWKVKLSP
jgi:WD40 repeat protein